MLSMAMMIMLSTFLGISVDLIARTVESAETAHDNKIIQSLAELAGAIEGTRAMGQQVSSEIDVALQKAKSAFAGFSGNAAKQDTVKLLNALKGKAQQVGAQLVGLSAQQQAQQQIAGSFAGMQDSKERNEAQAQAAKQQEVITHGLSKAQSELEQIRQQANKL